MKTSTFLILGLIAAFCIVYCSAAPECSSTERAKRDTKADKKNDKSKGASGAKKPEDEDGSSEEPAYKSKPGDKADVSTYKNKREANPGKDCKGKTTNDVKETTAATSDDTTGSSSSSA